MHFEQCANFAWAIFTLLCGLPLVHCPPGLPAYQSLDWYNSSSYLVHVVVTIDNTTLTLYYNNIPLTQKSASDFCALKHSTLPQITSQEMNDKVQAIIAEWLGKNVTFWLGFIKPFLSRAYVDSSGVPIIYDNFKPSLNLSNPDAFYQYNGSAFVREKGWGEDFNGQRTMHYVMCQTRKEVPSDVEPHSRPTGIPFPSTPNNHQVIYVTDGPCPRTGFDSNNLVGIVAGVGVGVLCLAVVVVFLCVLYRKRKRNTSAQENAGNDQEMQLITGGDQPGNNEAESNMHEA